MGTTIKVEKFNWNSSVDESLIREVAEALEYISLGRVKTAAFNLQKDGKGPAFKNLVESTLQGRHWSKKHEIVPAQKRAFVKALYYDRWKEEDGTKIAFTWGFHHQQGIMRNILKPSFHRALNLIGEAPSVHIIVAPSQLVKKTLGMNAAQADSESFSSHLDILATQLPVPTLLFSVKNIE